MAETKLSAYRKLEIEDYTTWLHQDYFEDSYCIDPFILIAAEGLTKSCDNYGDAYKAMIEYADDLFHIFINMKEIDTLNSPEVRYSVAHELGHYFIPEHHAKLMTEGMLTLSNGELMASRDIYEKEAEFFASCLLMPRKHFLHDIEAEELSFNRVVSLAEKYNVSLTAILLRYQYLSNTPMMIICSRDGVKGWRSKSRDFPYYNLNLGENYEAPASTAPQLYFSRNIAVTNETRNIPADLWFNPKTEAEHLLTFREFNFLQKTARQVITVVWKNP